MADKQDPIEVLADKIIATLWWESDRKELLGIIREAYATQEAELGVLREIVSAYKNFVKMLEAAEAKGES